MSKYKESVSGFKRSGDWTDVVEHGEKIAYALEELSVENELLEEFNEWRPKATEDIDTDINEKTVEKAVIKENEHEKESPGPTDDILKAGQKAVDSCKEVKDPDTMIDKSTDSIRYVGRAVEVGLRRGIRFLEKNVYEHLMTKISPYYFDNELVSANIDYQGLNEKGRYTLEVNINDDSIKSKVSKKLEKYEDKHIRWHISVKRDVSYVEEFEGCYVEKEMSEPDESNPNPQINH